jgi:vesicle-fusing ATPase
MRKAAGGQQAMQLRPVKSPAGNAYAFGNLVAVSPLDFREQEDFYLMLNKQYVLTARPFEGCRPGEIGLTDRQRTWARIGLGPNDLIQVEKYEPFSQGEQGYLGTIDVEIGFASKKMTDQAYDQEELEKIFVRTFENQILAPGQILLMGKLMFLLPAPFWSRVLRTRKPTVQRKVP